MVDSIDIYRSIREVLEKNFKKIKVQSKDFKNPRPPCFYVKSVGDISSQSATEYENNSFSYSVIYFSKTQTLEDLITVKESLKKIFKKPLKVVAYDDPEDTNYIEINSINTTMDEMGYMLNCVLDIEHIQKMTVERYESTNNELMEEMEFHTKIN